jgi:RND superfamily putative drug exporter
MVFQRGWGEWAGLQRSDQIEAWIPVFLFAMLFGLSMDYEVFLVTRMREAWDDGADNVTAVAHGLERTGRIITAAAVIMCAAFAGFMAGRIVGLQEFGLGLAGAVFVDATLVRSILVPSLMAVLGRWNWWLPPWAARLVRVAPGR